MAHNDPFSIQIGSKKTIFKRFYQLFFFFKTAGFQHNLLILIVSSNIFIGNQSKKVKWVWSLGQTLGQIRSNVVKKAKELVFHILHEAYIYKQKGKGYRKTWVKIGDYIS